MFLWVQSLGKTALWVKQKPQGLRWNTRLRPQIKTLVGLQGLRSRSSLYQIGPDRIQISKHLGTQAQRESMGFILTDTIS